MPLSPYWKRTLLFVLGSALCVLAYLFLLNFPGLTQQSATAGVIPVFVLAAGTWWLTERFLRADGMSRSELGLASINNPIAHLGIGFIAGSILTVAWLIIIALSTGATWHSNPGFRATALVGASAFAFFNNVGEELVYRGYVFVRLADRYGPYLTVIVTSLVFAIMHLQAGIPWLSVVAGVFTSGLIFGAIFARWRSLPLALGFHVATNVVQDLSGLRTSAASLFVPAFPASAATAGIRSLGGIALINILLAIGILLIRRGVDNTLLVAARQTEIGSRAF
jgi:membrane protease YdiL (CAAX protease family)